ncbi:MAG: GNAT family N-acetyltransferase [Candidatus Thorarchaeota archaeon]
MPAEFVPCSLCQNQAEYICSKCSEAICANDARIHVICTKCSSLKQCSYKIHQAFCEDVQHLDELVLLFWGDPVQRMFDQDFTVSEYPAIVAECDEKIVGFLFYTPFRQDAVLLLALGVLPHYQGCGIGKTLVTHIEQFAREQGRFQLLVVTTNDNLPALGFYQRIGFQLFEVIPDVVAEKLGGIQKGVANIPIRDELRLRKYLQ